MTYAFCAGLFVAGTVLGFSVMACLAHSGQAEDRAAMAAEVAELQTEVDRWRGVARGQADMLEGDIETLREAGIGAYTQRP